ncbi:MAG: diaminopimelate epimerase [Clostridiales bacterium]|nr:diaminopimelate epimerase [Clostridiales bacterium]
MEFTKMHGIGNDYIYVNCMEKELDDPSGAAIAMSARRFSVGADGLVMICASAHADAKMRMFNADGSEGKMCGNAIRCVGKYLFDNRIVTKKEITIETLSGDKQLVLETEGAPGEEKVRRVSVAMGQASFAPADIPAASGGPMIDAPITVDGEDYHVTALSVGNPHQVLFMDEIDSLPLEKIGPAFENHPLYPERINTEFVQVTGKAALKMRVWERGSGETFACGTGACATVAAAVKLGLVPADTDIEVTLIGGVLTIRCDENYHLQMTGPAAKVYDGVYEG